LIRLKNIVFVTVAFVSLFVVSVWCFFAFQRQHWRLSLQGPYPGLPFDGAFLLPPDAEIMVDQNRKLVCFDELDSRGTVVALMTAEGKPEWSYILTTDHHIAREHPRSERVRQVIFLKKSSRSKGYDVEFLCFWAAGKERGMVHLDRHFRFKGFSLSW